MNPWPNHKGTDKVLEHSEAPYHADSPPLKSAFASNLDSLVEQSRVPPWIHGHTH